MLFTLPKDKMVQQPKVLLIQITRLHQPSQRMMNRLIQPQHMQVQTKIILENS